MPRNPVLTFLICSVGIGGISCNSGSSTSNAGGSESSYTVPDQITLTASASRDESNGTVISGTTNLPDGTKVEVELMNWGRTGYRAQDQLWADPFP